MPDVVNLIQKLSARIGSPDPDTGCWPWIGSVSRHGYGVFHAQRNLHLLAHRAVYEACFGRIPVETPVVRHRCDNRRCCNPSHLEIGTNADNMNDKVVRGRQAMGEGHGNSKMTDDSVSDLLRLRLLGWSTARLADRFGISKTAAKRIANGTAWKHVSRVSP